MVKGIFKRRDSVTTKKVTENFISKKVVVYYNYIREREIIIFVNTRNPAGNKRPAACGDTTIYFFVVFLFLGKRGSIAYIVITFAI